MPKLVEMPANPEEPAPNNTKTKTGAAFAVAVPKPTLEELPAIANEFVRCAKAASAAEPVLLGGDLHRNLVQIRKLISGQKAPVAAVLSQEHLIGEIVRLLDAPALAPHAIRFEAAWVLTNIASGDSTAVSALLKHAPIPALLRAVRCWADEAEVAAAAAAAEAEASTTAAAAAAAGRLRDDSLEAEAAASLLGGGAVVADGKANEDVQAAEAKAAAAKAAAAVAKQPMQSEALSELSEQGIWSFGNIAGDGIAGRDACLADGVLGAVCAAARAMLAAPHDAPRRISLLRNAAWTVANLCRGKPRPAAALLVPALLTEPLLHSLLEGTDDAAVHGDACWALSYLTASDDDIAHVVDARPSILPALLRCMEAKGEDSDGVIAPALRAAGNVVSGTEQQTQAIVDAGVLPILAVLVGHCKPAFRKDALWAVSNIAAGSKSQAQAAAAEPGLLGTALRAVLARKERDELPVQKEAVWVLSNLTTRGRGGTTDATMQSVVDAEVLEPLCALCGSDSAMHKEESELMSILEVANAMLQWSSEMRLKQQREEEEAGEAVPRRRRSLREEMERGAALEALEALQVHPIDKVYKKACEVVSKHWVVDEAEVVTQGVEQLELEAGGRENVFVFK